MFHAAAVLLLRSGGSRPLCLSEGILLLRALLRLAEGILGLLLTLLRLAERILALLRTLGLAEGILSLLRALCLSEGILGLLRALSLPEGILGLLLTLSLLRALRLSGRFGGRSILLFPAVLITPGIIDRTGAQAFSLFFEVFSFSDFFFDSGSRLFVLVHGVDSFHLFPVLFSCILICVCLYFRF